MASESRHTPGYEITRDGRVFSILAWGTQKDNADDRERHGRTSRGAKHSQAIKAGLEARYV